MKKAISLTLTLAMLLMLVLSGCGGSGAATAPAEDAAEPAPAEEPVEEAPQEDAEEAAPEGSEDASSEFAGYASAEAVEEVANKERVTDGEGLDAYYHLTMTCPDNPTSLNGQLVGDYVDYVYEATDGHVEIEVYYSATLCGINESYSAVAGGLVDIADFRNNMVTNLTRFNIISQAGLNLKHLASSYEDIMVPLMEKFPSVAAEVEDFEVLAYFANENSSGIHTLASAGLVKTPEDVKDKRLITINEFSNTMFGSAGAANVNLESTDWATAFSTGLADGIYIANGLISAFSLQEVLTNHTMLDPSSLDTSTGMWVISKKMFEKLPAEYQDVLKGYQSTIEEINIPMREQDNIDALAAFDAAGGTTYYVTEEEQAEWDKYVQIALDEYIDNLIASGITDAREILDYIIELNDALD